MESQDEGLEISEASNYTELAEILGLIQDPDTNNLRTSLVEQIKNSEDLENDEDFLSVYRQYEAVFIEIIKQYPVDSTPFAKGQIAALILKASLFQDAGNLKIFKDQIEDVIAYAENMGFTDLVTKIRELSQ